MNNICQINNLNVIRTKFYSVTATLIRLVTDELNNLASHIMKYQEVALITCQKNTSLLSYFRDLVVFHALEHSRIERIKRIGSQVHC